MKPKIVIIMLLSVLLLVGGYWLVVNRGTLPKLSPSSQSEAPKSEAPKSEAPKSETTKVAPITNSFDSVDRTRKSYEILNEINNGAPPSENVNKYFFTDEQAARMGLRKYRSGPCAGYYQGEEWACNPAHAKEGP